MVKVLVKNLEFWTKMLFLTLACGFKLYIESCIKVKALEFVRDYDFLFLAPWCQTPLLWPNAKGYWPPLLYYAMGD
jgi:hypothetical protein